MNNFGVFVYEKDTNKIVSGLAGTSLPTAILNYGDTIIDRGYYKRLEEVFLREDNKVIQSSLNEVI